MTQQIKPTEYLYGVEPHVFSELPYADALHVKCILADELLHELLELPLESRDLKRITDVFDSVRFNKKLLEEIGYQ